MTGGDWGNWFEGQYQEKRGDINKEIDCLFDEFLSLDSYRIILIQQIQSIFEVKLIHIHKKLEYFAWIFQNLIEGILEFFELEMYTVGGWIFYSIIYWYIHLFLGVFNWEISIIFILKLALKSN